MRRYASPLACLFCTPLLLLLTGTSECTTSDADGDGYTTQDGDCDDSDSSVYPNAPERCDGIDSNCYKLDEPYRTWFIDLDQDGWGDYSQSVQACQQPSGTTARSGDCDDEDSNRHPRNTEICNGIDEDCNGLIDDGLGTTMYRDADGDGFGSLGTVSCGAKTGYIAIRGDCDDSRADSRPGAPDSVGDGRDQDCGGFDGPQPQLGFGSNPANGLQSALDNAPAGATVWVGPGIHSTVNVQFPARSIRLMSTHLAEQTTFDAQQKGRVLSIVSGNGLDTVIDGFCFKNGSVLGANGGAILVDKSSPTLERLIFEDNSVSGAEDQVYLGNGGAVALLDSSSVLRDVRFTGNQAVRWFAPNNSEGGGYGGAIYVVGGAPKLSGIVAESNDANQGGFLYGQEALLEFRSLELSGNTTHITGQAVSVMLCDLQLYGGIIQNHSQLSLSAVHGEFSTINVAALTYRQNRGEFVVEYGMARVVDSIFSDNEDHALDLVVGYEVDGVSYPFSLVSHTLFVNNVSSAAGIYGAMRLDGFATIDANTFVGNSYREVSGISFMGGTALLDSNLFAHNIGYDLLVLHATAPLLTYNNFYNPSTEISPSPIEMDTSNTRLNPRLVAYSNNEDSSDDNLHLLPDSPVKDSGNPALKDSDGSQAQVGAYGADALADAYTSDQDKDGLYDGWENQYGLNTSLNDAAADFDQDGATNLTEFMSGLNPSRSDCDGDGQKDGAELTAGSDPLDWYQRVASSGGGVVKVTAQVPGDFTSPQAAIRAINRNGEIALAAGIWSGAIRMYGKDLTLIAPEGTIIVPKEGEEGALLEGRFGTMNVTGVRLEGNVRQTGPTGASGFSFFESTVHLKSIVATRNTSSAYAACDILESSAVLENVVVEQNQDPSGWGLTIEDSLVEFENVSIVENAGGGLVIKQSAFAGHFLDITTNHSAGGWSISNSSVDVGYCRLLNNFASNDAGGLYVNESNVLLSHCIITGNDSGDYSEPAIKISGNPSHSVTFDHSIIAYNQNSNLLNVGASVTVSYSNFYNPPGVENTQGLIASATTTMLEPLFMQYDADGIPLDLHLSPASPLVNAGSPTQFDADGSRADLGMYGGAEGDLWDRDQDGVPDYFWPGTRAEAPKGFEPLEWDLNDGDAGVQ